jgi:hypothetical protein
LLPTDRMLIVPSSPSHLVILQHGLYGEAFNLAYLHERLTEIGDGGILAHLATSNEGLRTRDGVAAGGRRLAEEVRSISRAHPSLRTLSLVGNSLGGLYVRAAATELQHDAECARLERRVLLTTGCPHLGVRRFTYLPLPGALASSAAPRLVAGRTADELLLSDNEEALPKLVSMSMPESAHMRALGAFRQRRLYANLVGDFMVPFGTAGIETGAWGAGVGDGRLSSAFTRRDDVSFRDAAVCAGEADGVAVVVDQTAAPYSAPTDASYEEQMRCGLSTVSWSKVGSLPPPLTPLSLDVPRGR